MRHRVLLVPHPCYSERAIIARSAMNARLAKDLTAKRETGVEKKLTKDAPWVLSLRPASTNRCPLPTWQDSSYFQ